MASNSESGAMLTVASISDLAVRIASMFTKYNEARRSAMLLNEEVREYLFSTDIDSTSAVILPHKNRTHQPKLTQISDNLQSQYWDAALASAKFFKYDGATEEDKRRAFKIEAWVRHKLEQKKFRQTIGRQLIADYVNYGNCFATVDFVREEDQNGNLKYQGPVISRVSPLDVSFNARAKTFMDSPKIERTLIHVADLMELAAKFPTAGFDEEVINTAVEMRSTMAVNDWVDAIKDRGLVVDGFSSNDAYFKQDMVELLVYRGDMFDPDTSTAQKNRVIYVIDRMFVIRNEASRAPRGFDGMHHAGWRVRNDNLWAQGALDNLVGMQYRIDHLENLKADVFDLIATPVLLVKGENVQEPADGWRPGATYYVGLDEDVKVLNQDTTALQADNQIELYHRLMEQFAGAPPETAGIRTPGEKTAFEVNKLDSNATKMFVDKVRNFELLMEGLLQECFQLIISNFDGSDFVGLFDDLDGAEELAELTADDVVANGQFITLGSQHWSKRNRETVEMQAFQQGPMQDPKIRAHINGEKLATFYENRLGIQDDQIIEPFAGVKEDVAVQLVAQTEQQRLSEQLQLEQQPGGLDASGQPATVGSLEDVQIGAGAPGSSPIPS